MQKNHEPIDEAIECLGHWNFEFGYYLEFGYWDLGFQLCDDGREMLQSTRVIINFDVSQPLNLAAWGRPAAKL